MDFVDLVRTASKGDVKAFVALTRRFQHLAFGSAFALLHDFQLAEDVTQDAFIAVWSALPKLSDPAAFPGWLRTIVRHCAFRILRRRQLDFVPLTEAAEVASEEPTPDRVFAARHQYALMLRALADLSPELREPATLFYIHDCSQPDIAAFLNLPVTTVNNRLHTARVQFKRRMPAMVENTLPSQGLPNDFANRVGRLVAARGSVVDAQFDPASLPDLLTELLISDEAGRRAVTVQVVQRPGGGIVRGVAIAPPDRLQSGASVLSSSRQATTPLYQIGFEHVVTLRGDANNPAVGKLQLIETGIKVIDVMCPLVVGGTIVIAGEPGAGQTVLMEELVRRLSGGSAPVSLFLLMPPSSPQWPASMKDGFTLAGALKEEGYSEGTVGSVQSFFLRGQEAPWTEQQLSAFNAADVVIHLSNEVAAARLYPAVDPRHCRSRLLEEGHVGEEHAAAARCVKDVLTVLSWDDSRGLQCNADPVAVERARKLMNYFTQPFFASERYTQQVGSHVSLPDAVRGAREIIQGQHDDLPVKAFYFGGSIDEIRERARHGPHPA
ncbi:MAG TPA: sigma-70 family RNA polymerase sigma factor [Terracidiphilus sp.]|nr:sigma-70 family RNA polymerase sigma factor [Terracidiphilus sp.]HUB49361.1 sigma-70 family RNA polymerase sigma factor [Acetobacteraceae bacterium]